MNRILVSFVTTFFIMWTAFDPLWEAFNLSHILGISLFRLELINSSLTPLASFNVTLSIHVLGWEDDFIWMKKKSCVNLNPTMRTKQTYHFLIFPYDLTCEAMELNSNENNYVSLGSSLVFLKEKVILDLIIMSQLHFTFFTNNMGYPNPLSKIQIWSLSL